MKNIFLILSSLIITSTVHAAPGGWLTCTSNGEVSQVDLAIISTGMPASAQIQMSLHTADGVNTYSSTVEGGAFQTMQKNEEYRVLFKNPNSTTSIFLVINKDRVGDYIGFLTYNAATNKLDCDTAAH